MKMRGKISSVILRIVMYASAGFTAAALLFILGYILAKGIPNLTSPGLVAWEYTSDNVSLVPAAINTLMLVALALVMSIPFGIGSAIYLTEYAKKGNKFVSIIRVTTETLSGIPSIIYGLFGMLFFVKALKWQYSILAGAATVAIMVLPTIMRTTEEALLAVPDSFREASLALGAGKIRTIFNITCLFFAACNISIPCYSFARCPEKEHLALSLFYFIFTALTAENLLYVLVSVLYALTL